MAKLDGKFHGRIFRDDDNTEVPPEDFVVFLARDNAFPTTLAFYLRECQRLGCSVAQTQAVAELYSRVNLWRAAHPEQCVNPGERLAPLGEKPKSMLPGAVSYFSSANFPGVFWLPEGTWCRLENRSAKMGWYFWDEVGLIGGGPYPSDTDANQALQKYVTHLNAQSPSGSPIDQSGQKKS